MADRSEGNTRTPRASETRETAKRESTEQREATFDLNSLQLDRGEMLPVPDKRDGIDYRYVRIATRNEVDGRNYSAALRNHWSPVSRKDVPELDYVLSDSNHPLSESVSDGIIIGGLILCQRATEIGVRLAELANQEIRQQVESVNRNYLREGSDARMPKFSENRSSVKFGD